MSRTGVVSAGDRRTAEVGAAILRAGGNAVDAAVGAVCAAFATEPALTGPFGGGFAVVAGEHTEPETWDFFAEVPGVGLPAAATDPHLDFAAVEVSFGAADQVFHVGRGASAVGLLLPGIIDLHRKHGHLPLPEVVAPARALAEEGVPLSDQLGAILAILQPILRHTPEASSLFAPGGRILGAGDRFHSPGLANLLDAVAQGDRDAGRQALIDRFAPPSGRITAVDLDRAHPVHSPPVTVALGEGLEAHLPRPPSSGGLLVAFGLRLLADVPMSVWRDDLLSSHHLLAAMAVSAAARRSHLDAALHAHSPDLDEVARHFVSDAHVDEWREDFHRAVTDGLPGPAVAENHLGSTTHVSVVDTGGLSCSITHSNGEGCGWVVPGTGVLGNNFLGEEDLHPNGFHHSPPGTRLTSMMCPTLVTRDGEPIVALGSGGSNRIRSAVLQVLTHHLFGGLSLVEAVNAPRMHLEGETLYVERTGVGIAHGKDVLASLEARVPKMSVFDAPSMFFGGVHAAGVEGQGAGDPRRGGAVSRA